MDPQPWNNRAFCAALGYCCRRCYHLDRTGKPQHTVRHTWDHTDECEERLKAIGPAEPHAVKDKETAYYVKLKLNEFQLNPQNLPSPDLYYGETDFLITERGAVPQQKDPIQITPRMLLPDFFDFPTAE